MDPRQPIHASRIMPRYFFKIPFIALLGEGGAALLDEACGILNAVEDTINLVSGVSIRNADIELNEDTQVGAEFWLVKDVTKVDFEDAMKGSDGILVLVDPAADPGAATTLEYAGIIEKAVRFLPTMVSIVDAGGQATFLDDAFIRQVWDRRVVECMAFNRSAPGRFLGIVKTLLRGIVDHPEAGPIDLDTAWLREGIVWETMARKIEADVTRDDQVFLGRNFHVLSLVARARKKVEALVLGSIGARWLEMASEYMLAARVCEQLGEVARALFLKKKHLQYQMNRAAALHAQHKFRDAASKYQELAYWNRNEYVDPGIAEDLFIKAIDAWTSVFEFDRIPDLLRQVKSPATQLAALKDKITRGVDYLASQRLLDKANFQLDEVTALFLKHDLRDSATELAKKHAQVKLDLLKEKITQRFIGDSLALLDEIVALRERMGIPVPVPDQQIAAICVHLIENMAFHEFEKVIALVQDPLTTKQLSARRVAREKEAEIEAQERQEAFKKSAYQRLLVYHKEEKDDALVYARARRKLLVDMASQGHPDRAATFLSINAAWLRDLDMLDIAADLVYQVADHLVKCGSTIDLKSILGFLPLERREELVTSVVHHIKSRPAAQGEADFSKFIEYYQTQARNNHFHAQADELASRLAAAYLNEARMSSKERSLHSILLARGKLEKYEFVLASIAGKEEKPAETDDIIENIINFYIDTHDLKPIDDLLNQLKDLDRRKRFSARLVQIDQEEKLKREGELKKQESTRALMEDLQEVKRMLVLENHHLLARRAEREAALRAWKEDKKIAELMPCFMTKPDQVLAAIDRIEKNEQLARQFFARDKNHQEFALSVVVSQLIALKRGDLAAATKILKSLDDLGPEFKLKVTRLHAWRLAGLLGKAVGLEVGSGIVEAVLLAELLPLLLAERALAYMVLSKPVPPGVLVRRAAAVTDDFAKKLDEALPVIVEMVSMDLEPGLAAARVRRQLLDREGKLQGLPLLKGGKHLDKAAMLYQNEAFSFLDAGDLPMGWASLWTAVMVLVRERVNVKEITAVVKNVSAMYKDKNKIADNLMINGLGLFLKCIERNAFDLLRAFSGIFDVLPLLDEERELFDTKKLHE
ncbi:MAG: hypothetical protein JW839_14635 [Candidatus Lokiarchaeota archaeon]|nr:hypothetical protein [Candidatus Lokiarchaeota archaeon]